jgi:hypothetical protein
VNLVERLKLAWFCFKACKSCDCGRSGCSGYTHVCEASSSSFGAPKAVVLVSTGREAWRWRRASDIAIEHYSRRGVQIVREVS